MEDVFFSCVRKFFRYVLKAFYRRKIFHFNLN